MEQVIKRPVVKIDSSGQWGLFRGMKEKEGQGRRRKRKRSGAKQFEDPSPQGILIGNDSLAEFLVKMSQTWVFLEQCTVLSVISR